MMRRLVAITLVPAALAFACRGSGGTQGADASTGGATSTGGSTGNSTTSSTTADGGANGSGGTAPHGGAAATAPLKSLELSGDITEVHDPAILEDAGVFYLFSTGTGIALRTSTDLKTWTRAGQVFSQNPSWIGTALPSDPPTLWAPEAVAFGGKFHLYYSASSFGSQNSCIGHATRSQLQSGNWVDDGMATICTSTGASWNAIDPNPLVDGEGNAWLAMGSFWTGIKLIELTDAGRRSGNALYDLATRADTEVEAPHLFRHGSYYYLFESLNRCCKGVDSTYKIAVGRAAAVQGPFFDRAGVKLADGGGTVVLEGDARWKGPGHNAILQSNGQLYLIYHSYDALADGIPTLRISELAFDEDGWPVSAGP